MFNMPGTRELRISDASSLNGFASSITGVEENVSASSCEMKLSDTAS